MELLGGTHRIQQQRQPFKQRRLPGVVLPNNQIDALKTVKRELAKSAEVIEFDASQHGKQSCRKNGLLYPVDLGSIPLTGHSL